MCPKFRTLRNTNHGKTTMFFDATEKRLLISAMKQSTLELMKRRDDFQGSELIKRALTKDVEAAIDLTLKLEAA